MSCTEPIRSKEELKRFMDYYRKQEKNDRNYALICVGLNSALRISDILSLKWDSVYNFKEQTVREYISLTETKTKKNRMIIINCIMRHALLTYLYKTKASANDYIFASKTNPGQPLSRVHAYRIIKKAAYATLSNPEHISCHSLRKTFGYHAWKQGAELAVLTDIFNHSSYAITKRYLGITQDDQDNVFLYISFQ